MGSSNQKQINETRNEIPSYTIHNNELETIEDDLFTMLNDDVIGAIVENIPPSSWLSILLISRKYYRIANPIYKNIYITKFLNNHWKGKFAWSKIRGNNATGDWQTMEMDMTFKSQDSKYLVTGKGINDNWLDCPWIATGKYDLTTNEIEFEKEFIGGVWKGRKTKYIGKFGFEGEIVIVSGEFLLLEIEEKNTHLSEIGDKGIFDISSTYTNTLFLQDQQQQSKIMFN